MKTKKMSLENIKGKLSRAEMKNIMAGSGGGNRCCDTSAQCQTWYGSNCGCMSDHICGCVY